MWFINSCLTVGAFGMVWYKPWSNGSGIPETKCVLNGVSIPQVSEAVKIVPSIVVGVQMSPDSTVRAANARRHYRCYEKYSYTE